MSEAASGNTVKVHYTGTLTDGGTIPGFEHPLADKNLTFDLELVEIA